MGAPEVVFGIPEMLELILLALPGDTTHQQVASMRTLLLGRTTCRTWHRLIERSTPIRRRLYLPTRLDDAGSGVWEQQWVWPPSAPNPFLPQLLLSQRSWGSAYPFDAAYSVFSLDGSPPRFWTFSLEMSRSQYDRLPPPSAWRRMLASDPPFVSMWATRTCYELGSGRAPFVIHEDYEPQLSKSAQSYSATCSDSTTLGLLVDAIGRVFDEHPGAQFVLVESFRAADTVRRPAAASLPDTGAERESV